MIPTQKPYAQFIEQLIKRARLDALPEEELQKHRDELTVELEKRIGFMILRELSGDMTEEYLDLLSQGEEQSAAVHAFLQKAIPDFPQKVEEELVAFGKQYLGAADAMA